MGKRTSERRKEDTEMRGKRFWPVAAVVLVIFTVCLAIVVLRPEKGQDLGDAPPELTVVCGGRSVTGSVINYSWPEAIACGMEPLAYVDTAPALARGGEDTARLTFAVEPEQVTVNGWRLMDGQGGGCGMADVSMRLPGQKAPVGVKEASVVWLWVDMIVGSMGSQMIGTEGSTFSTMMGMMGDPVYKSVSRFGNRCEKRGLYLPK